MLKDQSSSSLVLWLLSGSSLPSLASLEESTAFSEDSSVHSLLPWPGCLLLGSNAKEINVRIHCKCSCWQRTNIQRSWAFEQTQGQQKVPYGGTERRRRRGKGEKVRGGRRWTSDPSPPRNSAMPGEKSTWLGGHQVLDPPWHPLRRPFTRLWRSVPSVGTLRPHASALYNAKSNDHPILRLTSNATSSIRPPWSLQLEAISPLTHHLAIVSSVFLGAHESQKEVSRNSLVKG